MDLPPIGCLVDVKKHGQAHVVAHAGAASSSGRVLVQYLEDGSTFWARQDKLRQLYPTAKQVLVAYHTEDYRQAVVHNVSGSHTAVEIGCHEGITTRIIHNRCRSVVGIDLAKAVVDLARQRSPDLHFEVLDGSCIQAVLALSPTDSYDRVMIDISGQAGLSLIVPLVHLWVKALPQAVIIVKNRALHRAVQASGEAELQPGSAALHESARQATRCAEGNCDGSQQPQTEGHSGADADCQPSSRNSGSNSEEPSHDAAEPREETASAPDPLLAVLLPLCETFRHRPASYTKCSETERLRKERRLQKVLLKAGKSAVSCASPPKLQN